MSCLESRRVQNVKLFILIVYENTTNTKNPAIPVPKLIHSIFEGFSLNMRMLSKKLKGIIDNCIKLMMEMGL